MIYRICTISDGLTLNRVSTWEKTMFEGKFSPGEEKQALNEKVYSGNNRNYWQIYFTHDGENYKINKNNAMFNLFKKSDNGGTVTIEICPYEDVFRVHFIAPSGKAWFKIEKGNRLERGILVKVRNELSEDISDIRVLHAESDKRKIQIETGGGVVWREFVKFSDREIKGKTSDRPISCAYSSERVEFHYYQNYWQVYFTRKGICYELEVDVNFNLSYEHNGRTLDITILHEDQKNKIYVKFEMLSKTKTVLAYS